MFGVDQNLLLQFGAGVAIAIFTIKHLMDLIKWVIQHNGGKKEVPADKNILLLNEIENAIRDLAKKSSNPDEWTVIVNKIHALYDWHNQKDGDGAFIWYNKKSTYEKLEKIENHVSIQSKLIDGLIERFLSQEGKVKEILDIVYKIKNG